MSVETREQLETYGIAFFLMQRFVGVRYAEDVSAITNGSLLDVPDASPGTADWQPRRENAFYFVRGDPADYWPAATGTIVFAEKTYIRGPATSDVAAVDHEMAQLEEAAQAGDERAFLRIEKSMNWVSRPPEDYIHVVQLALAAGAHLAARRIATQGAGQYPNHQRLKKYARILAPPKVMRLDEPPTPGIGANHEWLKAHGDENRGQWVALKNGKLLRTASTLKELVSQTGETEGILFTKVY